MTYMLNLCSAFLVPRATTWPVYGSDTVTVPSVVLIVKLVHFICRCVYAARKNLKPWHTILFVSCVKRDKIGKHSISFVVTRKTPTRWSCRSSRCGGRYFLGRSSVLGKAMYILLNASIPCPTAAMLPSSVIVEGVRTCRQTSKPV